LVRALESVAARKGATPAQVALAWLLAQYPWIVPIPGTKRLDRLKENLGAATITLSSQDLESIDDQISDITVQGARYPDAAQRLIDR